MNTEKIKEVKNIGEVKNITEAKEYKDNCVIFLVGIILIMCFWIFFSEIWEITGKKIPQGMLTKIIELIALASGVWYANRQKLKLEEVGLGTKRLGKILCVNFLFSIIVIGIMIFVKSILIKDNIGGVSSDEILWDWNAITWASWIYPITAFAEELIINGFMQESLDKIFEGKYKAFLAIAISSIYFGAVHIHRGLLHMTIASLMSLALCVAYRKQRNVWGISLSHYMLGMAATFLGFI